MHRTLRFLFLIALASGACSSAAMAKPIGLVTGPETGTYIAIGRDIAAAGREAGIPIEVKPSLGSIDNLRRMSTRTESAGLGLVQSDVLSFLKRSQSPESQSIASKIRLVAPMYAEEVHLLANRAVANVSDLSGKRIVVGTEGSGSMLTALNLFGRLGVKPGTLYKVAPPEAVVAVLTGQADAAIIVGGAPMKLFKNMEEMGRVPSSAEAQALQQIQFLPLDDPRLREDYEAATLSRAKYAFLEKDVPTVAVHAMLVAYDFTLKDEPYYHARCAELGRLGAALRAYQQHLPNGAHPKWREVDFTAQSEVWSRDACIWPSLSKGLAQKQHAAATPPTPALSAAPALDLRAAAPKVDATTSRLQQDLLGQLH